MPRLPVHEPAHMEEVQSPSYFQRDPAPFPVPGVLVGLVQREDFVQVAALESAEDTDVRRAHVARTWFWQARRSASHHTVEVK